MLWDAGERDSAGGRRAVRPEGAGGAKPQEAVACKAGAMFDARGGGAIYFGKFLQSTEARRAIGPELVKTYAQARQVLRVLIRFKRFRREKYTISF